MKDIRRIGVYACAAAVLASCSVDESSIGGVQSGNMIKVSVEALAPGTDIIGRTTFDGETLVWTGNETLDVLIGDKSSDAPAKSKAVKLKMDSATNTFSGMVDLGAFTESDIRAVTVPADSDSWIRYYASTFRARIPLKMYQVQQKNGVMNGDNFPLYAAITDDVRSMCRQDDGSYKFGGIQLQWGCAAIRFNVFGAHPQMSADEVLKSICITTDKFPQNFEVRLQDDYILRNSSNYELTVALEEPVTIADKTVDNGIKVYMAMFPYRNNINSVMVETDKAVYAYSKSSGPLEQIEGTDLRGKVYRFGLDLSKYERVATPVADLLDVEFKADGSAVDKSASALTVEHVAGSTHVNYFNSAYSGYVAHFNNPWGQTITSGYYKIDYASNTAFRNAMSDGHSMEMVFRMDEASDGANEIKPFSTMEKGGTGFLVTKAEKGTDITFLPNVSTNDSNTWIWAQSGITPVPGRYYHVVGVYSKADAKAYIYVDGTLRGTASAPGNFRFPTSGQEWIGIGADPYRPTQAHTPFKGDVAIARIYDAPLSAAQVGALWSKVSRSVNSTSPVVTDVSYLPSAEVRSGCFFHVYGTGFKEGDAIRIESLSDNGYISDCETIVEDGSIKFRIPSDASTGSYRMVLTRDMGSSVLGSVDLTLVQQLKEDYRSAVVAHRGYHHGDIPDNSMESLLEAQRVGAYGTEFDIFVTTDDVLVLYHDAVLPNGSRIDACTYDQIKDVTLSNGETLPTFEKYLQQGKLCPSVRLVCEIKTHADSEKNMRAVEACVAAVRKYGMEAQMDYIAFDFEICRRLAQLCPDNIVQYLNGDKAPSEVKAAGIGGIDYKYTKLTDTWIEQAHELGMKVNVWTVNTEDDILKFISKGVDYLTSDEVETAMRLAGRTYVSE